MSVSEATPAGQHVAVPGETCPRCHTTSSWGENSWCPDCGYYPIVDAGAAEGESWSDRLPEVPKEAEDTRTALESIPMWFWGMIAGIVGITLFSVAIRVCLPGEEGESVRGTITLVQLTIGAISALTAHIIATRFAMANDHRINLFDFVIAWFAIWQPTILALPKNCMRLLSVVWGSIAVITALTIIGGVDWSAAFRPAHEAPKLKPMSVIGAVEAGMNQMAGGLNEDLDVDGKLSDLTPEELAGQLNEAGPPPRRDLTAFVYGVITNEKKVPTSFLFAATVDGVDQHVVELHAKDVGRLNYRLLVTKLGKAIQKTREIPSEREATWVKPVVHCRLSFQGITEELELDGAKLESFVVGQRGVFDAQE